jgi:catechol 2,3-dioxygenase-like lactoylglutathione lyase family enzyme
MVSASAATRPRLACAYPQLFVSDVEATAKFYVNVLGFKLIYLYGKPPFYGLVERDGAGLNFRHVDAPIVDQALRERESYLSASIPVYGVEALYDELKARGAPLAQDLKVQPWGAKDFIVRDPDGHMICFGSATA